MNRPNNIETAVKAYNNFAAPILQQEGHITEAGLYGHGSHDPGSKNNKLSRKIVKAYMESHPDCVVGIVNKYREDEPKPWMFKPREEYPHVFNFECSFVLPQYDEKLEQMLEERRTATYTGTGDDLTRILAIEQRIYKLGGEWLIWC